MRKRYYDGRISAEAVVEDETHRFTTDAEKAIWNGVHPATMITQDATHRFVTDAEKTLWNNLASTVDGGTFV